MPTPYNIACEEVDKELIKFYVQHNFTPTKDEDLAAIRQKISNNFGGLSESCIAEALRDTIAKYSMQAAYIVAKIVEVEDGINPGEVGVASWSASDIIDQPAEIILDVSAEVTNTLNATTISNTVSEIFFRYKRFCIPSQLYYITDQEINHIKKKLLYVVEQYIEYSYFENNNQQTKDSLETLVRDALGEKSGAAELYMVIWLIDHIINFAKTLTEEMLTVE